MTTTSPQPHEAHADAFEDAAMYAHGTHFGFLGAAGYDAEVRPGQKRALELAFAAMFDAGFAAAQAELLASPHVPLLIPPAEPETSLRELMDTHGRPRVWMVPDQGVTIEPAADRFRTAAASLRLAAGPDLSVGQRTIMNAVAEVLDAYADRTEHPITVQLARQTGKTALAEILNRELRAIVAITAQILGDGFAVAEATGRDGER